MPAASGVAPELARDNSVAILAPTGRDGPMAKQVLWNAKIESNVCADMRGLCEAIANGVAAVLIAEEALAPVARVALTQALDAQPSWSDVSVIVLTSEGELSVGVSPTVSALAGRASVTFLERPVRVATLVTVLGSALRARQRQYDVRDYLAERLLAESTLRDSEQRLRSAVESARASREAAESANRAKSDFLAVMSHELRTPLNAIAGYCDILDLGVYGPVTGQQRDAIGRIKQSEVHLLSLINDVLNLAKIESGRVQMDTAPVDVGAVARSMEALIAPQLLKKHQAFESSFPPGPAVALADAEKAGQVILNLLSNAVKFTGDGGGVHLAVSIEGDRVVTRISDSGPGIPPDKLEAIFEPFVQVGRTKTSGAEGTGLGLAISRDLARLMKGDLTVESPPGHGATFTFSLPAFTGERQVA